MDPEVDEGLVGGNGKRTLYVFKEPATLFARDTVACGQHGMY